ncbi:MAG TPA: VWA domain-containing protein [Candidatus Binataceae bacterium]
MGLLYPGALVFLALLPALVLAYLARERPARVIVSSVLAFRALRGFRRERFGGWPRLDWMFFAELFILSLAVLAMAGPYIIRPSNPLAIVIDNSAATQARTAAGASRFDEARVKLLAMLAAEDGGKIAIYLTAPQPHRLAPPFDGVAEAREAIARVRPTDAPNDPAALTNLLGDLASEPRYRRVIFAGARAIAAPVPPRIHAIAVGDAVANVAIGSFVLRREVFGAEALHARLTIANFSPDARKIEVTVSGDGRELARARETLSAGETGALEFPALASARVYRAELSPADAFPLDNLSYATATAVKSVAILFVSPVPADAAGLEAIPGVSVRTQSPSAFTPRDFDNIDLAIFEYTAPKDLPMVNTLLVMPPAGDPVLDFHTTATSQVQIAGWHKTDSLTDSVNFRLLNLRSGEYFAGHPWMAEVVSGDGGGLLLKGERGGHRIVAAGFNPFPYLGRRNLPMSVLTLNVLSYLAGLGANSAGYRTGQPWLIPAGVEQVVLPSGRKISAKPGTLFTEVSQQGVYELIGAGTERTPRAVNLADLTESDLENVPPLHVEVGGGTPSAEVFTEKSSFSGYLLAAIIALAALEAMLVYRRRRQPLGA